MLVTIPNPSLILLIGMAGSGKSTFANKYFEKTQIVSSDSCRAMISDNLEDQTVTPEAFELLHFIVKKRLHFQRLTIVDATNLKKEHRVELLRFANEAGTIPTVAFIFDIPMQECIRRDAVRIKMVGQEVIEKQAQLFLDTLSNLQDENYSSVQRITTDNFDQIVIRYYSI